MKRSKSQRNRDRRLIASLYLKGEYQADIAEAVGISQGQVSKELAILQDEWQAASVADIDKAKARELAKIDALEVEYWQAWKRSQENAEVETTKMQGSDPNTPGKLEKQRRVEGQVGDPRFLQGVERCIQQRREILGIDAPKKQEFTGKDGEALTTKVIIEYADNNNSTTKPTSSTATDQERTEEV